MNDGDADADGNHCSGSDYDGDVNGDIVDLLSAKNCDTAVRETR